MCDACETAPLSSSPSFSSPQLRVNFNFENRKRQITSEIALGTNTLNDDFVCHRINVRQHFTIRNSFPSSFLFSVLFFHSIEKFGLIPISFLERNVTECHKNLFYSQSFITLLPLHFEFAFPCEIYDDVHIVGIWFELCADLYRINFGGNDGGCEYVCVPMELESSFMPLLSKKR